MRKIDGLCVAALLGLAACGGGAGEDGGTAADSAPAASADVLPDACTLMREADLSALFAGEVPLQEQPAASTEDVSVSNCTAYREQGNVSIGLLVRQRLSGDTPPSSSQQAEDMIATTKPGEIMEGMVLEPVEGLGEAALWSPETGQLNLFYRDGRAYVIVTAMNTPDNKAAALSLAKQVLARHP